MARRYRKNDDESDRDALIPPLDAYGSTAWEEIEEFAASGERVAATDLKPWVDPTSQNDYYIAAGGDDSDEIFAAEYLFPRREPLSDWNEAERTEGVWMVYFAQLQSPTASERRLWRGVYRESNTVGGYDVRMSQCYLFRGTGAEVEDFGASVREAVKDWVSGEARVVVDSGATTEHTEYEYVRVYDASDPEDISAYDGKVVVLQDTVFGLWWTKTEEAEENVDVEGPFETESGANRSAQRQANSSDDRTRDESGMNADQVYLNRQADPEDEMPPREGVDCTKLRGTIAIVYQPKLKRLMRVVPDRTNSIEVLFGDSLRGSAYLDDDSMGQCARTHSPSSRVRVGTGDGMALYTGLATLAYQGCERECIGSCPTSSAYGTRSGAADRWWAAAVERGLAEREVGGCDSIQLETLVDAGLVFWMQYEGHYAGWMAAAREKYAAAFASAEPDPDPDTLKLISEVLSELIAEEDYAAWRAAHLPDEEAAVAATPNRRGARSRKPAFVTEDLEAYVDELYAGLEGL